MMSGFESSKKGLATVAMFCIMVVLFNLRVYDSRSQWLKSAMTSFLLPLGGNRTTKDNYIKSNKLENESNALQDESNAQKEKELDQQETIRTIYRFDGKIVFLQNVAIVNGTIFIFSDEPLPKEMLNPRKYLVNYKAFINHRQKFNLWDLKFKRVEVTTKESLEYEHEIIDETAFFHSLWHPNNMFHLNNDNVIRLAGAILQTEGCNNSFSCTHPSRLYTLEDDPLNTKKAVQGAEVLDILFDLPPAKASMILNRISTRRYFIKQLVWGVYGPPFYVKNDNELVDRVIKPAILRLREKAYQYAGISSTHETLAKKAIYMSRQGQSRHVSNYKEVLDELKRQGFQIEICCDFKKNGFKNTLQVLSQSNLIVGPHGAGQAHLIYMPANSTLISFFPKSQNKNWLEIFDRMANYSGSRVYNIEVKENPSGLLVPTDNMVPPDVYRSFHSSKKREKKLDSNIGRACIDLANFTSGTGDLAVIDALQCSDDSVGNMLARYFILMGVAASKGIPSKRLRHCTPGVVESYLPRYNALSLPPQPELCKKCNRRYLHTSDDCLNRVFPLILNHTREAALNWRKEHQDVELDDIAIHIRCGDVINQRHFEYGWMKYKEYDKVIIPLLKERGPLKPLKIGIIAATHDKKKCRPKDCGTIDVCEAVYHYHKQYFEQSFGHGNVIVTIRNGSTETVMSSISRLLLAPKAIICNPSTFCMFPAVASIAENSYLVRSSLYPWTEKIARDSYHVLKVKFLTAGDIHAHRMSAATIDKILRSST